MGSEEGRVRFVRRRTGHTWGGGKRRVPDATPGSLAALPADSADLEDLLATIEQHVELGIADNAALARSRALHNFDVLALELEKLDTTRTKPRLRVMECPSRAFAPLGYF